MVSQQRNAGTVEEETLGVGMLGLAARVTRIIKLKTEVLGADWLVIITITIAVAEFC